jgi:hypothetical protein
VRTLGWKVLQVNWLDCRLTCKTSTPPSPLPGHSLTTACHHQEDDFPLSQSTSAEGPLLATLLSIAANHAHY